MYQENNDGIEEMAMKPFLQTFCPLCLFATWGPHFILPTSLPMKVPLDTPLHFLTFLIRG